MPRSDSAGPGARDGSGLPRADRPDPKRPDSLAVARAAGRRADQAREPEAPRPSKRRHGIGCAPACCRGSTSHGRRRGRCSTGSCARTSTAFSRRWPPPATAQACRASSSASSATSSAAGSSPAASPACGATPAGSSASSRSPVRHAPSARAAAAGARVRDRRALLPRCPSGTDGAAGLPGGAPPAPRARRVRGRARVHGDDVRRWTEAATDPLSAAPRGLSADHDAPEMKGARGPSCRQEGYRATPQLGPIPRYV